MSRLLISQLLLQTTNEAANEAAEAVNALNNFRFTGPIRDNVVTSVLGLVAIIVLRTVAGKLIDRQFSDARQRYIWRKSVGYVVVSVYVLALIILWLPNIQQIIAFVGFFAAALAVVLRDPLVNFVGWLFILWRQPFRVGDRIQLGENSGDVIDIALFKFTLMEIGNWVETDQSTGRIVHIPNSQVFLNAIANYSQGFKYIWHEIPVLVTFESDWEEAKRILFTQVNNHANHLSGSAEKHLRKAGQKYMIFYSKLTPTVYTTVKDSGILLTMRYLCDPRQRRGSEQVLWENILREFAKNPNISLAYPTQRFYMTAVDVNAPLLPKHKPGAPSESDRNS